MRWFVVSGLLAAGLAPFASAQAVDILARAYRDLGSPSSRASLARFGDEHAKDAQGALARFALASGDLQAGRYDEALAGFLVAAPRLPEIADLAHFGAAKALVAMGRKNEAAAEYEAVAAHQAVSSQLPWAVLAAGGLLVEAGQGEAALKLVAKHRDRLPAPQGIYLYGAALDRAGKPGAAVVELRKVYFDYPRSDEARRAEAILLRLEGGLAASPAALLERARKLMEGGDPRRALTELQAAAPGFTGPEKDLALVRIGGARHWARDNAGALPYLKSLKVEAPEADAERLNYIVQAARRLDRYADVDEAVRELGARHGKSRWRMTALAGAANRYLIANDNGGYEPLFAGCAEFAPDSEAALCHWKLTWSRYLRKRPDATRMLREHVEKFPASEDAAAAMYFLGRTAERDGYLDVAKAHYQTVSATYPNFYYAVVSRERLRRASMEALTASTVTLSYLKSLKLPSPGAGADFGLDDATRLRLRRARLLNQAAADDWTEAELRYGARNGAKAALCLMELSKMAQARGENGRSLRFIKGVPGFLTWRLEDAPNEFWKLAFPMPYREPLERYAESESVDPYVVAGLIRQESEFDPAAISRANARGLTQVLPGTGRDVARRLGLGKFSIGLLHEPDSSLRIGISYLRQMLDSFSSKWYLTLAAYNAGPSRAHAWVKWANFEEAPEFIETIPFHETRHYVQTVLRNADLYRRIWAGTPRLAFVAPVATAAVKPPVAAPKKATTSGASTSRRAPARRPAARR